MGLDADILRLELVRNGLPGGAGSLERTRLCTLFPANRVKRIKSFRVARRRENSVGLTRGRGAAGYGIFKRDERARSVSVTREEGKRAPARGCGAGKGARAGSARDGEMGRRCRGGRRSKRGLWHAAHAGSMGRAVTMGGVVHGPRGFLGVSRRIKEEMTDL